MHLVTGSTAGLGDDLLHVLNLSLAADEGTELERKNVSVCFEEDLRLVCSSVGPVLVFGT